MSRTTSRKADHLRLNLDGPVEGGLDAGFDAYRFEPDALPDLDLAEVSTEAAFLGRRLGAPVLISCMTGGTEEAALVNGVLAQVAQTHRLALGLGSGRVLLQEPGAPGFDVRARAPDVPLLCNLGAAQLNRSEGIDDARRLLELTAADAIVIHLNSMQEALQPEGEPSYRGLLPRLEELCRRAGAPVIVKEVGFGIAADVAQRLFDAGVEAVDVAGAGGTSWSEVERRRLSGSAERVAGAFSGWGIPTAEALVAVRAAAPGRTVIASGGVRDGMDVAVALALGADLVGLAGPFLRAAGAGRDSALTFAAELIQVLRLVMFGVGARDIGAFQGAPRLVRR